jgi:multidrug efflux system membrane fusion protein
MDERQLLPPAQQEPRPLAPEQEQGHKSVTRQRWKWLAIAILLGLVIWVLVSRHGSASAKSHAQPGGPPVVPVDAVQAYPGDIGVYFTGLGAVTPIYTVTVRTQVNGELMHVYFREGQMVHKGELLAEVDPRPYQVQLTQAEGQLLKDQAALENARIDLTRYTTLLTQNAVPEQTVATQKALILQDEGTVKTDQGMIDSAKLNLVYCRITSPIDGRVGLRLVDPGNIVHTTDTNGLMVITQLEPITVIFTISEDQVPTVLQKMRAKQPLRVDAYDRDLKTKLAEGVLTTLDNQIDQTTGTLRLRATFANKGDVLFPNQFVNARLLVDEKHGVTLVPSVAIQRNSQATYVYLVKPDQTVTVRQVTVGTTEGGETEVDSGLSPGDTVVTTGVDKLQEGTKVAAHLADSSGRPGS